MEVAGEPIRVQSLIQSGLTQVPPQYIQPIQNRPIQTDPDSNIPTIDLFHFHPNRRDSTREAIAHACRQWGAFHVINHGIPTTLLNAVRNSGLKFFNECPMSEKLKYSCTPGAAASEGYGSRMLVTSEEEEHEQNDTVPQILDWRDYFDHHTFPLSRRKPNHWPNFSSDYRELISNYSDEMKILAQKLLALISESLGLQSSCIEDCVGEIYQNITISYYPPCPQPELTLGLQSHSDFGAITLLIQDDVGGLQALKNGDDDDGGGGDRWVTVQPLSDAILVLLSDQTEIITNGKYKSCVHRAVTNPDRPRLSVATFHDPAKTAKISPVSELINDSSPAKYRGVVYGDYVSSWYTKGPEGKRNIDALVLES